jgi:DNA integrity scanning protein DisA with diadenylate cyclase activity
MMEIPLPWWFVVLYLLVFYCIPIFLSGLGIYYLVKGNFNKIILIVSSFVFLIPIVLIVAINFSSSHKIIEYISKYLYLELSAFFNSELLIMNLTLKAIIYLSSFAIVNSIYLLYRRVT